MASESSAPALAPAPRRLDHKVPRQPATRSPYDPWHSEEYLVGWLCRLYGWQQAKDGSLRPPGGHGVA